MKFSGVSSRAIGLALGVTAAFGAHSANAQTAADEIIVIGKSYGVEVGAKSQAPLKEIPNTITLVDQARIQEQNLFTLNDLITQTTGLTVTGGDSDLADFRARGFAIDNYLVDGVPNNGFGTRIPDLFVYDRVEILRGPAGLFSGAGNPAGSINLVRKRPLPEFAASARASAGSWNNYRGEVDVSAPVNDQIGLRGGLAYQDREQFYDVADQDRLVGYGSSDVQLTDATTLSFGVQYDRFKGQTFSGLPGAFGGGVADYPRSTYAAADWNRSGYKTKVGFAELRQELGNNWVVRASGQYGATDTKLTTSYAFSFTGVTPADGNAFLLASELVRDEEYVTADLNAVGAVSLFGREHEVIVGADFQKKTSYETFSDRYFFPDTFDLYNPDYDAYPQPPMPATFITDTRIQQKGVYGQLRYKLADPLTLVLGGRVGWYDKRVETLLPASPTSNFEKNGRFTPYAGVVFDVTDIWSLYASYGDTFTPQDGVTVAGDSVSPAKGKQYEAGVKASLAGDRLLVSAAIYQIKQTGRAQADPFNIGFSIQTGEQKSEGVELEANGEILPGWRLNGGYAYNHNKYVNDPTDFYTAAFALQAPRHSVKLWTIYQPVDGPWAKVSLGGGVTWQSRTSAALTFLGDFAGASQDSFFLANVRAGYDLTEKAQLALSVNNVFDKKYYDRLNGVPFGNFYGAPRNFMLTARIVY